MTVSAPPSTLSIAVTHAKLGRRVALCCPPGPNGECHCGGKWDDKLKQLVPHTQKEVGKAPIGRLFPKGINDATTNTAKLDSHLRAMPDANVSIEVQSAGWLVVDTDSPEAEAAALSNGLKGAVIRESRNRAYVFERPADCPIVNLIKADGDPLDILTFGNFLVHGTHATGAPIRLDPLAKPGPAPERYVEMVKQKAAQQAASAEAIEARRAERAATYGNGPEPPVRLHQRGIRRWTGELVEADRSDSLFFIGLDLAECGATESAIVAALRERDEVLGWHKYTERKDDREYERIAEKAVTRAVEREQAPQIKVTPKVPTDGSMEDVIAFAEATAAENARLLRVIQAREDRLDILEGIVHGIDDILSRPDEELCAADKVVAIGVARWLPSYRSKAEANERPATVALGYVAKVVGLSPRRVSQSLDRLSSNDPDAGAPFRKRVTRVQNDDPDGPPIISSLEIIPWRSTTRETLATVAAFVPAPKPKHGGSRAATEARWGRCDRHDNDLVRIKGHCPDCGLVVGERLMSVEEFDALNVQDVLSADPAHQGGTSVDSNSIGGDFRHSEHADCGQDLQLGDSGSSPVSLLEYAASRPPDDLPKRCPTPDCRAMEFRQHPDGSWRCLKSGHDLRAFELLPAIKGASE
jgi:hypothetical protein